MSIIPVIIILLSAFIHATWNFLAKLSKGGFVFVWFYMGVGLIVYFPFVLGVIITEGLGLSLTNIILIFATSIIHTMYAVLLQRGYKVSEFSIIYPVARGTASVLIAIAAIFLFHEKLTSHLIIGIILIVLSIFLLTGGWHMFRKLSAFKGVAYGMIVALFIAGYTLIDKEAMSVLHIHPLIFYYGCIVGQFVLLTPYTLFRRKEIRAEWVKNKKTAIGVGVLNPLAYMLVLVVMIYQPVGQIAPLREMSILIGVVLGAVFLSEELGRLRIIAACIMVVGVVTIVMST